MKKILFLCAVAFGLASCSKNNCYECSISTVPGCTVDICEQAITTSGTCAGVPSIPITGLTNDQIRDLYVQSGFTCTSK